LQSVKKRLAKNCRLKLKAASTQLSVFFSGEREAEMRRRRNSNRHDLTWDGRAVWCPRFDASLPGGDLQLWMCAEDAGLVISTQFDRLKRKTDDQAPAVELSNCSGDLGEILADSITRDNYDLSLVDSVADFVRMIATHIITSSEACYEIRGGWDQESTPWQLKCAQLMFVQSESILGRGPWRFQIAKTTTEDFQPVTRVIRLDPARIVKFNASSRYRRTLKKIRVGLRAVGESEHSWRTSIDWNNVQEDFKSVSRSYSIQRARVTAPIGWNGRGEFRDYMADYQYFHRHIKWIRFCIVLRDSILAKLSQAFGVIGSLYGENPKLKWTALPTITNVENAEALLIKGARFDDITKALE
jgi:hypothetical protein